MKKRPVFSKFVFRKLLIYRAFTLYISTETFENFPDVSVLKELFATSRQHQFPGRERRTKVALTAPAAVAVVGSEGDERDGRRGRGERRGGRRGDDAAGLRHSLLQPRSPLRFQGKMRKHDPHFSSFS